MSSVNKRHQPVERGQAAQPPTTRLTTDGVLSWLWGIGSGVTLAAIGFLAASEHAAPTSGNALAPPVSQPDHHLAAEEADSP